MDNRNTYVLVTPAHNEEAYLERTIQSVVAQTILPQKWVIVSDRSTDRTDDIARQYAAQYDFITYIRTTGAGNRNFGAKVDAFNLGYQQLNGIDYHFLGNLDADISLPPTYYEQILGKFRENTRLGVAGGIRYDVYNGKTHKVLSARNSIAGAFQVFRRQCYEAIGGFLAVELGSEDTIAQIMARMQGWETEAFSDIVAYHHRGTGVGSGNVYKVGFRAGVKDYLIGHHPLFELVKCLYRVVERPFAIGSVLRMSGYVWASSRRYQRPVSEAFVSYLRAEQLTTLRTMVGYDRVPEFGR